VCRIIPTVDADPSSLTAFRALRHPPVGSPTLDTTSPFSEWLRIENAPLPPPSLIFFFARLEGFSTLIGRLLFFRRSSRATLVLKPALDFLFQRPSSVRFGSCARRSIPDVVSLFVFCASLLRSFFTQVEEIFTERTFVVRLVPAFPRPLLFRPQSFLHAICVLHCPSVRSLVPFSFSLPSGVRAFSSDCERFNAVSTVAGSASEASTGWLRVWSQENSLFEDQPSRVICRRRFGHLPVPYFYCVIPPLPFPFVVFVGCLHATVKGSTEVRRGLVTTSPLPFFCHAVFCSLHQAGACPRIPQFHSYSPSL